VAYRIALDHPDRIQALAVLDVVPTETVWERADARSALAFWPWSLLAQPSPLPERILTAAADAIVEHALAEWGSPATTVGPDVRAAYVEAFRDPEHAHAVCEEYRAAATLDREHDRADRERGLLIRCPVLVLWSAQGPLQTWYADAGGPLGVWRDWADHVQGQAMQAGHFLPRGGAGEDGGCPEPLPQRPGRSTMTNGAAWGVVGRRPFYGLPSQAASPPGGTTTSRVLSA
jgi:haloacetate dehalogenase